MAHNKPTGSKGNCTPEYGLESLEASEMGVDGNPVVLDTRGKAPRETYEAGAAPLRLAGGKQYVGPEASPDSALSQFTKAKAGGRYGSNKASKADIPLSSQGPETRDGA